MLLLDSIEGCKFEFAFTKPRHNHTLTQLPVATEKQMIVDCPLLDANQCDCRHATGKEYSGRFKNCSINCLWMDGKAWKVGLWGDITHLSGIGVQAEAFGGGNTG